MPLRAAHVPLACSPCARARSAHPHVQYFGRLCQFGADVCQCWSVADRILRPQIGRRSPDIVAQICPTSFELGQNRTQSGRNWPNSAKYCSNPAFIFARFCPMFTNFDPNLPSSPQLWRKVDNFDRNLADRQITIWAKCDWLLPNSARSRPEFTIFGQFGRILAKLCQSRARHGLNSAAGT